MLIVIGIISNFVSCTLTQVKWEKVEWSSGLAQQKQIKKERDEMAKEVKDC